MPEDLIDRIAGGYRSSQALFTACRLGVFAALANATLGVRQVADLLKTDLRGTRILLDALVGLGLLRRSDSGYANTELAKTCLVPDAPGSRLAHILHGANLYDRWGGLPEAVRTGRPVSTPGDVSDPARAKADFARAMAASARHSARLTAEAIDLRGVRSMLDIGGGPGVFAAAFAQRQPGLTVTVLDDAETLRTTAELVAAAELQDRIRLEPGDAFESDLAGPWDLILVSNVVHIYSDAECRRLTQRCAEALAPGGRLLLKDFFVNDDRTEPAWSLLFAVNMLLSTERGDSHRLTDAGGWLQDAGLQWTHTIPITEQSLIVVGARPVQA